MCIEKLEMLINLCLIWDCFDYVVKFGMGVVV